MIWKTVFSYGFYIYHNMVCYTCCIFTYGAVPTLKAQLSPKSSRETRHRFSLGAIHGCLLCVQSTCVICVAITALWTMASVIDRITMRPGPWFNIKMSSYQYRKSHCGDKTVVKSSYLHNGIFYTGKMSSLYWIRAHRPFSRIPIMK